MQFPELAPIKPINLPDLKPIGTDSKKQSLQEWHAAGGGVPKQYKGREHVWHAKVKKFAEGGEVHMGAGGVMKGLIGKAVDAVKGAQKVLPAAEREANKAKFLEGSAVPPVVYHATSKSFPEFSPKKLGKNTKHPTSKLGFFTAANPESTEDFVKSHSGISKGLYESGANIMPLHLSIKNPFEIPSSDFVFQSMALQNMKKKDADKYLQEFIDSVKSEGHDGLVIKANPRGFAGGNEFSSDNYVAFEPTQIKSAIGNRGTYDTNEPDLNKARGGDVHMAGGGDPLDEFSPPRYRSAGRRPESQQDRRAAANMPMDFARGVASGVLGAPGDIESFIRMLPGFDEKTVLPTSEDIEKRIPLRSDTPAGRAASGLGTLAGGFYMGPGAPIRLVGGLPQAVYKAGKDFAKASGQPAANVVKPTGGNFLTGRTEKDLQPLKSRAPTHRDEALLMGGRYAREADTPEGIRAMAQTDAFNKWVDSNLTNYVKKQMGTPDDPVRKLAEEGITHKPGLVDEYRRTEEALKKQRMEAGFPEGGMGQSPTAKAWERASDEAIAAHRAGDIQEMPERYAKFTEAEDKMRAARNELDEKFKQRIAVAGLNDREIKNLIQGTPFTEKAKLVGDTDFLKANEQYYAYQSPMMDNYIGLGRDNPYISKLAPETPLYAPFTGDLGFDHIMDVLREDLTAGRIRPEQMNKISMSDAVRRTYQYDQELAAKMNSSRAAAREGLPTYKEYPEGYRWVELNKPGSFANESEAMGHSVRGYEPPKGHPDWTEASGDRGSSSYGHGGWEAIKSGNAKVYSLVDSKGAPHATVEVGANRNQLRKKDLLPYKEAALEEAKKLPNGYTSYDLNDIEIRMARENMPAFISQIKGKGNRAPNEEYLPYVQDFVRSGKWSDVNDLQNTGLIKHPDTGELVTSASRRQEMLDEIAREAQPPEGMAKGGVVHMQKGGKSGALVSIAEAVAAASKKADEILDAQKAVSQKGALSKVRNESKAADEAMEAKRLALEAANPPIKASEAYGQHEGAYLKPIFYDRMKVDLSKRKFGGPGFSGIQLVDPNYANAAAGVTDKKMATRILNRNEALVPKGAKVIWTPSVGGLEQHKSNSTMFGEFAEIFANQRKNMSAEEIQKLSDKASSTVDNKGRLIFPNGIDLASRNFRQKVVTYPQRSLMADIFAGRNVGGEKGRTVPVEELLEKNLDPNMAGAGTLDLGNRLFRLEGNVMDRPDLHSDYRKILTGEDLNVNYLPVPIRNVYGDWEAQKKLDLLAQGKDRDVTQMDYTKNDPTVQLTDKLLTELQKRGYKEGGAVEKRFDGGGMAAAEFAGPGDDGGSLDKAKIMSKLLADMAKEQGSKEADSLSKPRAATDLLNRGVIANNPLSAIVDMVNMGLIPLDILGSKLTGRDIKVSSDKPFLGSEHVKDLMNKYNITSGEERPMMETALSFASPTGMIKGAQKTAELAKKAPEALSNVRGGLETLSADAQRPFRSATLTMEGVAPDLGQKGGDKFKDLVTKRMISGEGAPVGMERMGGRKTKKTTGQGLYENFAGQQETNPMVGVTIPRAGNLSTNKRLIADIGTAGRELGQEMVAAHKFTPLMFKNPKDATAMMIGGSERLTKDQIQNIAKALPGMIVTHSPKNNSMFVAPFEGDALDYKKASQTASEILGKGAKVQFGKADSNKDIMFRGDYDKMGARPSSAESTEMRNRLKKAEERIVRGPSVSQSGRQSQPSTLTSTVR